MWLLFVCTPVWKMYPHPYWFNRLEQHDDYTTIAVAAVAHHYTNFILKTDSNCWRLRFSASCSVEWELEYHKWRHLLFQNNFKLKKLSFYSICNFNIPETFSARWIISFVIMCVGAVFISVLHGRTLSIHTAPCIGSSRLFVWYSMVVKSFTMLNSVATSYR